MSNEVKIGILAIVSVIIGIWGFSFMKGQKLFANELVLTVDYDNVAGLGSTAPIFLNGFNIGQVTNVTMNNETQKLIATLNIDRAITIHKNALAVIGSSSIMGGKDIKIVNNRPCSGGDCVQTGGKLNGLVEGMLSSMVPKSELDEYMGAIQKNVGGIVDGLNQKINEDDPNNTMGATVRDLNATMANLKATTEQLNSIMQRNANNMTTTMANFAALSASLAANNDKITSILANTDKFTNNLGAMQLDQTLSNTDTMLVTANQAMGQLQMTLASSDTMVQQLNMVLQKVANGEGSLGMLMSDTTLYNNITSTTEALDVFLTDFQEKPYRYMPFKSRRKVLRHDRKDAELAEKAAGGN